MTPKNATATKPCAASLIPPLHYHPKSFYPFLAAAKVDVGWHALRHFAVSTWIEAGLQPKAVQALAGHATYAITMSRYGHLFPAESHAEAMDKIAEALFAK